MRSQVMARRGEKARSLQQGALPKVMKGCCDPCDPMQFSAYRRAATDSTGNGMPSEAYLYELIFEEFQNDQDFWTKWNVVECVRAPASSQGRKHPTKTPIRVVMDLEALVPLPRNYPPSDYEHGPYEPRQLVGLPDGYHVPLEAFTLQDGEILLDHQRKFQNGNIDPRYEWLHDIIQRVKKEEAANRLAIADEPKVVPRPKAMALASTGFVSWLSSWTGTGTGAGHEPELSPFPAETSAPIESFSQSLRMDFPNEKAAEATGSAPNMRGTAVVAAYDTLSASALPIASPFGHKFQQHDVEDYLDSERVHLDDNLRVMMGLTPLHFAAKFGSAESLRLLLDANADVGAVDEEGLTPLHVAIKFGSAESARLLLGANADVNARNISGLTPLHVAVKFGSAESVRLLLGANADVYARSISGWTPKDLAAKEGWTPVNWAHVLLGAKSSPPFSHRLDRMQESRT
ncbi:unnamed protein product [Polarella glacialis]|uniref:Uncharacterized protein n=1 Tax=Polarella glacialis TaxID=89957 RepID=A0A813HV02_POLGL|nr:unnamed protein product [Polarella glacialis]CAE8678542.1 unnamed protein product [Polarella glacialis]